MKTVLILSQINPVPTLTPGLLKARSSKNAFPSSWAASILKMGQMGRPETSVSNPLTPHNNTKDGRIDFNLGGSLKSRKVSIFLLSDHNFVRIYYISIALHTLKSSYRPPHPWSGSSQHMIMTSNNHGNCLNPPVTSSLLSPAPCFTNCYTHV